MDRAGGWYKKKIRPVSIIIATVLVLFLNIDTIEIIQKSIKNPKQLEQAVNVIEKEMSYIDTCAGCPNKFIYINIKTSKRDTVSDTAAAIIQLKKQVETIAKFKATLNNSVFKIGYQSTDDVCSEWTNGQDFCSGGWWSILLKLSGLFLTVLALQVGSNFWFDTLNKVINLRNTGKKPEATPENP